MGNVNTGFGLPTSKYYTYAFNCLYLEFQKRLKKLYIKWIYS